MKGQYFSFDAIIASVIFVLALVALLSYWHSVKSFLDYQSDPLSRDAIKISNLLFAPPSSYPSDCSSLERLGFGISWDDRRLNYSTIMCASSIDDQEKLRGMLGTQFNVSIKISDAVDDNEGTILLTPIVIGGSEDEKEEANNVVNMRRLATVVGPDGSTRLAKVDLSVYK